jgi:hypothetical protein
MSSSLPQWEREYRHFRGGPSIAAVLAVGLLFLLLGQLAAATQGGRAGEHRMVSPACAEAARLRAHGATGGQPYRSARAACARAEGR